MVEQLPVQRGAADAEVGGDLFGDSAVPDLLGGSGTLRSLFQAHPDRPEDHLTVT